MPWNQVDISNVPDDVILYILRYVDTEDRITFASTCQRFRQLCLLAKTFRKLDLSRCSALRRQQGPIQEFFRDKQFVQHIRELNLNNYRMKTWQMDDHLEKFIVSISPQLEALHVLNCGMSFQRLHHILQQAPKLTALSCSLRELTIKEFLTLQTSNPISLESIRYLHIELLESVPHLRVLEHLVSSCHKHLEELEVIIWQDIFHLEINRYNDPSSQPSSSVTYTLQNLHSLTVLAMGDLPYHCWKTHLDLEPELSIFISSLVRKKPKSTKWKKLWISEPICSRILEAMLPLTAFSVPRYHDCLQEFSSVQAITAHAQGRHDYLKTLFQKIGDNSVRDLHLCANHRPQSNQPEMSFEIWKPILRIGGRTLKSLSLRFTFVPYSAYVVQAKVAFDTLFSTCSNIAELDLLGCHFEKDICEAICKLKRLVKMQVPHCAILSKHKGNQLEKSNANFQTFVENCQNITAFDVHGCDYHFYGFSCCLYDDDLLALAKLTNLKSLTLHHIADVRHCTFLKISTERCKFLTMLRIKVTEFKKQSYIPILESAKFLKHLAMDLSRVDLRSKDFWKLLSHATNLERLCIKCDFEGPVCVTGAIEILARLPRLHAFHLHVRELMNTMEFYDQIMRALENEKSDRKSFFEFLLCENWFEDVERICNRVLPLNAAELCCMTPSMAIPTF